MLATGHTWPVANILDREHSIITESAIGSAGPENAGLNAPVAL